MRTIWISVFAMGACGDGSGGTLPAPPMPAARLDSMPVDSPAPQPACYVRYGYPSHAPIECRLAFTGGDPDHYVTTCDPPDDAVRALGLATPALSDDVELDTSGRIVHELVQYPYTGLQDGVYQDITWTYDNAGRMLDRVTTNAAGTDIHDIVVSNRTANGDPASLAITQVPFSFGGTSYPSTANETLSYSYDGFGRVVDALATFHPSEAVFFDMSIEYEDAALRRNYVTYSDLQAAVPVAGPPGTVTSYDLVDEAGRILERGGGDYVVDNRYDDAGRVIDTIVTTTTGQFQTIDFVYDCP